VDLLDGMRVTTEGTIRDMAVIYSEEGLVGTSFSITARHENRTYSMGCMYFGADLDGMFSNGDVVTVNGRISYYTEGGCWQLVVDSVLPGGRGP